MKFALLAAATAAFVAGSVQAQVPTGTMGECTALFAPGNRTFVSLPNVLADAPLIPELLQHDCIPEKLAAACLRWFGQPQTVEALLPQFIELHKQLRCDASARAADAVAELIAQ